MRARWRPNFARRRLYRKRRSLQRVHPSTSRFPVKSIFQRNTSRGARDVSPWGLSTTHSRARSVNQLGAKARARVDRIIYYANVAARLARPIFECRDREIDRAERRRIYLNLFLIYCGFYVVWCRWCDGQVRNWKNKFLYKKRTWT